jgi:hypothetical protein
MERRHSNDEKQTRKSAFTLMNNIRDYCEQSGPKKLFLFELATYSDSDGICYPSNETLAGVTRKSRRTVQRMLKELVADGDLEIVAPGIGRDKKRIIRLTRYATIKGDKAVSRKGDKAMTRLNVTRSLGKRAGTDIDNSHEQPSDHVRVRTRGTTRAQAVATPKPESEKRFGKDYQNQPAQNHVKWPEFAAWCRIEGAKRSKGGQPTEKGFWTWLSKQAPQWRNKVRTDFDEEGYVLDGKFLPAHEANALATKNPDLLTRFQRAVKRDGKIQLATNGQ